MPVAIPVVMPGSSANTLSPDRRLRQRRRDCLAFDVMDLLQTEPDLSQRKIADRLSMSLGQVNYFLKMFANNEWIERIGLRANASHQAESYLLTDKGEAARSALRAQVLTTKLAEFDRLRQQIERLSMLATPDDPRG